MKAALLENFDKRNPNKENIAILYTKIDCRGWLIRLELIHKFNSYVFKVKFLEEI